MSIDSSKKGVAGSDTVIGRAYKISGADNAAKLEELSNQKYNGYQNEITANAPTKAITLNNHKIGGTLVADDAVIVVYDKKGASKTITGKQFNNLPSNANLENTSKAVLTKDYNGLGRVRLASVEVITNKTINDITGTSNDNYGYITSDAVKRANGDVTYTLWNGSKNLTVTEENGEASARAKGTVIGYSSIDSNGYIQDVDDTYHLLKNVTSTTPSKSALAVGANKGSETKSISVGDNQLNVTADTKVLVIDTSADGEAIGQTYTYGTTTLRKANKVGSSYQNNVAYILDEDIDNGKADLELLIIDNTGSFDWLNDSSSDTPSVEKGDYTSKFASVKVADKSIVTNAASSRNVTTNVVTVALTLGKDVKKIDATKISVKKDGTPVVNPDLSIKSTDTAVTVSGNQYIFTVAGVGADETLSIEVADGFNVTPAP